MVSESILNPLKRAIHHVIHASSPIVLGMRWYIGKNPKSHIPRDKTKIEYISGEQPFNELAFGVELGPNPHSKIVMIICVK